MPAGAFGAGALVDYRPVSGNPTMHRSFAVRDREVARGRASADDAYRRALDEGGVAGHAWITNADQSVARLFKRLVAFLATCGGFEMT